MEPDEIRVAIERAELKRREWLQAQPAAKQSATVVSALPRAAETCRRQIARGLESDARRAQCADDSAEATQGTVRLVPDQGVLWAEYDVDLAALLPSVQVVAGARYSNCLLTVPRTRRKMS
jgi:hypothetical protein